MQTSKLWLCLLLLVFYFNLISCGGGGNGPGVAGPQETPVDGGWSDWSFGACSVSCSGGTQTGNRTCTNPAPANGGADCIGSSTMTQTCNTQACSTPIDSSSLIHPPLPFDESNCGRKFYVSNSGNDSTGNGSESSPWKTIQKVNNTSFSPGDCIFFQRGGTWREILAANHPGARGNFITYTAYGSGEKPKILGSEKVTSWTSVGGNLWQSVETFSADPWTKWKDNAQIFFIETDKTVWGVHSTSPSKDYDWQMTNGSIQIYSTSDPNTKFVSVEVPQRHIAVSLSAAEYQAFDNLFIGYSGLGGIDYYDNYCNTSGKNGVRVTNCEIGYIGRKGSSRAYGIAIFHNELYFANNEIHDCGRRAISLNEYCGGDMSNILIENNYFHDGFHTTGVDISASSGGEVGYAVVRNNYFQGDPNYQIQAIGVDESEHMWIDDIHNLDIYNNVFTFTHNTAIKFSSGRDFRIFHNTFYGFNMSYPGSQALIHIAYSPQNLAVNNNIFYNDNPSTAEYWRFALKMSTSDFGVFDVDYNLYYAPQVNDNARILYATYTYSYPISASGFASYRSATGFGQNSPTPADPGFIDAPNNLGLKSQSDARGIAKGGLEVISLDYLQNPTNTTGSRGTTTVSVDYYGNSLNSPADLGAIQYK